MGVYGNKLTVNNIIELMKLAVEDSPRSFIALECCANKITWAKPDLVGEFCLISVDYLTESKNRFSIYLSDELLSKKTEPTNKWLMDLFLNDSRRDLMYVPFNYENQAKDPAYLCQRKIKKELIYMLPMSQTASRSCVAFVQENLNHLVQKPIDQLSPPRRELVQFGDKNLYIAHSKWAELNKVLDAKEDTKFKVSRFSDNPMNLAVMTSKKGFTSNSKNARLFGLKTGVHYVGSELQGGVLGKSKLESNARLATVRSNILHALPVDDNSFDIQTELLTIVDSVGSQGIDLSFQVRDLSCFRADLDYLPAQSIPYVTEGFWRTKQKQNLVGKNSDGYIASSADRALFWQENFAIPLGRAKAALFIKYGLMHSSANAQNFILGFDKNDRLKHFIMRDIGDTHWHDSFVRKHRRGDCFEGLTEDLSSHSPQTLFLPASGSYPAPEMLRLAAWSVATSGFGDMFKSKDCMLFIGGILDGFRHYCQEYFAKLSSAAYSIEYPNAPEGPKPDNEKKLLDLARDGFFPRKLGGDKKVYQKALNYFSALSVEDLLSLAAWTSKSRIDLFSRHTSDTSGRGISSIGQQIITLEEICLCKAIEKLALGQLSEHIPSHANVPVVK